MAHFAEVGIRVYFGTTVGTRGLADGLSTLGTEHGLRFIDCTAERTFLTGQSLLLLLLLLLMDRRRTGYIGLHRARTTLHFLRANGALIHSWKCYIIV